FGARLARGALRRARRRSVDAQADRGRNRGRAGARSGRPRRERLSLLHHEPRRPRLCDLPPVGAAAAREGGRVASPSPRRGEGRGEGVTEECDMTRKTETAKRLRRDQTDAERVLWFGLRDRRLDGWKFRRQMPVGRFVVDFLCADAKLIVELDG